MKLHELKILPKFYEKVTSGEKRFEIRKDDRHFKVGDLIRLNEFDNDYTGRDCLFEIMYKLDGGNYGLEKGYCILSIKPYRTDTYLGLTR
ncbi:MAG: ASCH/PUA domain-containing protein [Paeniclostridium sordellii]|nr:ASCH/PUA domain-containing protein [Paeniclostridium sordellii]